MITVTDLPIAGAKLFTLDQYGDNRGWFSETFRESWIDEHLPGTKFIFECTSFSAGAGTVRGLHAQTGDHAQAKLISVLNGDLTDFMVDARVTSPTYGQYCSVELSANKRNLVFIPKGCYHGFVTRSANVYFTYKLDSYYNAESECGLMYNDPTVNIEWRLPSDPILSQRDLNHPTWFQAYKF